MQCVCSEVIQYSASSRIVNLHSTVTLQSCSCRVLSLMPTCLTPSFHVTSDFPFRCFCCVVCGPPSFSSRGRFRKTVCLFSILLSAFLQFLSVFLWLRLECITSLILGMIFSRRIHPPLLLSSYLSLPFPGLRVVSQKWLYDNHVCIIFVVTLFYSNRRKSA